MALIHNTITHNYHWWLHVQFYNYFGVWALPCHAPEEWGTWIAFILGVSSRSQDGLHDAHGLKFVNC